MDNYTSSSNPDFEFNQIDVYQMEMFEVFSKIRNRSFRFARYNGNNYEKIEEYIHEVSPNTQIWPEEELRIGTLYGYSGRTFKFEPIFRYNIRCIIASNPFIKRGDIIKNLAVSTREIEVYLKQSVKNYAFRYGDILATFRYDDQRGGFKLFDQNHIKGIDCKDLPSNDEWYIGRNDGLIDVPYPLEAEYQNSIHQVAIRPKINELVDRIERLKLNINRTCYNKGEAPVFAPSWEYYDRIKCLSEECIKSHEIAKFANCMYSILFEETKVDGVTRSTLGGKKNDSFVLSVGELRNYYSHGNAEYKPSGMDIKRVFLRYLHNNLGPQTPNDFLSIQMGILKDFVDFLEKLGAEIRGALTISGIMMQDDNGHYYCGNTYIDPRFFKYKGCHIKSTNIKRNTENTADEYPYYCDELDEVDVNYSGKIQYKNEVLCCANCPLPDSFANMIGDPICITKIGVRISKNRLLVRVNEWHESYKLIAGIMPTVNIDKPCKLEKDSSGVCHVGNISINQSDTSVDLQEGDTIIIKSVNVKRNINLRTNAEYPLFATHFCKVED